MQKELGKKRQLSVIFADDFFLPRLMWQMCKNINFYQASHCSAHCIFVVIQPMYHCSVAPGILSMTLLDWIVLMAAVVPMQGRLKSNPA